MKKSLLEMNDIIIYGSGGFGRETALLIRQVNLQEHKWNILGFCDDGKKKGEVVDDHQILGGVEQLNSLMSPVGVVLAIADPSTRKKLRDSIHNQRIYFPSLIHPSVQLGDVEKNSIGEGSIICAGTIITTNVHIQTFCIINLMCSIGHDVAIKDYCSIMPCCSLSGFDTLENEVYIGSGARILPQVVVGSNSKVGAGAVVLESVPSDVTVVGVPAKIVK